MGQRSRARRGWRYGLAGLLVVGGVAVGSAATAAPACGDRGLPSAGCAVERAIDWSRAVPVTDGVCLRLRIEATLAATHDRQGVGRVGRDRYGDLVLRDVRRTWEVTGSCTDDRELATPVKVVALGTTWARDADAIQRANSALSTAMEGWGSSEPARVGGPDFAADYLSWTTPSATSTEQGQVARFDPSIVRRLGVGRPGCLQLEVGYSVFHGNSEWGGSATEGTRGTTFCL